MMGHTYLTHGGPVCGHRKDNFLINVSFEFIMYFTYFSCPYLLLEMFLLAINEAI